MRQHHPIANDGDHSPADVDLGTRTDALEPIGLDTQRLPEHYCRKEIAKGVCCMDGDI